MVTRFNDTPHFRCGQPVRNRWTEEREPRNGKGTPVDSRNKLCTPVFEADYGQYSWENRKAPEGYGFGGRPPTCSNRKGSADMLPITDQIALIRSIASSAEGRESDALDEVRAVLNGAGIDQLIALRRAVK